MTDFSTVAAVKAFIGKTDPGDDGVIAGLITSYSQFVRSYTRRDFSFGSYSIWRSGRGGTTMYLPQAPIVSVDMLTINGIAVPRANSFASHGYRATDDAIELGGGAQFTIGSNNIYVAYSAGFTEIPADIAQAVNELVALRYSLRGDKIGWTSKSLAGETVALSQRDMPASVATLLDQYARLVPL